MSSDYRGLLKQRVLLQSALDRLPAAPSHQQSGRLGYQFFRSSKTAEGFSAWVDVDLGSTQTIDAVVLVPVDAPYRDFAGPGYGFPLQYRVTARVDNEEVIVADFTQRDFPNPGGLPVWLPAHELRARNIRVTMTKPWNNGDSVHIYALGELMVLRGNRNLAAGLPAASVTASGTFESQRVWSKANLVDGQSLLGPPVSAEVGQTIGYHAAIVDRPDLEKWVQVDLGQPLPLDEVRLIGAIVPQYPGRPGFGFPVRFRVEGSLRGDFADRVILSDETGQDFPNPASNPVTIRTHQETARYVRVTATSLWERAENFAFALAELQVYSGDANVALHCPVTCLDQYPSTGVGWQPVNLTDGFTSGRRLVEWPNWLQGLSSRREAGLAMAALTQDITASQVRLIKNTGRYGVVFAVVAAGSTLVSLRHSRQKRRLELDRLRQHIANDLHDEIGSNLGTIALLSEMAMRNDSDRTRADLQEIHRVARQTAESMHDIVGLMHRPASSAQELVERLREIASRMLGHVAWELVSTDFTSVPRLDVQRHLLLMYKEALHNIQKHASPRKVRIELSDHPGPFRLLIEDDGVGFNAAIAPSGLGLTSLRHRAATLGGKLIIETSLGQGTRLIFLGGKSKGAAT